MQKVVSTKNKRDERKVYNIKLLKIMNDECGANRRRQE